MEILAGMFPRCSRILYCIVEGVIVGVGGYVMLSYCLCSDCTLSIKAFDIDYINRGFHLG